MDFRNLLNGQIRIIFEDATTSEMSFKKADPGAENRLEISVKGVHDGHEIAFCSVAKGIDTKTTRARGEKEDKPADAPEVPPPAEAPAP
jgi:hypothetical protein